MLKGSKDWFDLATKILEEKFSADQVREICNELNREQDEWQFEASMVSVMRRKR